MAWYWQLFPSQGTIKYNTCHTLIFFNDDNRYWVSSTYYETDVMEYFAISWVRVFHRLHLCIHCVLLWEPPWRTLNYPSRSSLSPLSQSLPWSTFLLPRPPPTSSHCSNIDNHIAIISFFICLSSGVDVDCFESKWFVFFVFLFSSTVPYTWELNNTQLMVQCKNCYIILRQHDLISD